MSREAPGRGQVALAAGIAAIVSPSLLTAILLQTGGHERNYVFLYMALVAVIAVLAGLWPSLLAAGTSFLLVDYFFVPPVGTFTITDRQDFVNLLVLFGTAGFVGALASNRRRAFVRAGVLARQLQQVNEELVRLNREQAEAAQAELRLAHTQQLVATLEQTDRDRRCFRTAVARPMRGTGGRRARPST
jgi:two-component system sensor histidine kinase KdpD